MPSIIIYTFITISFGIDRTQFTNFRSNERHDSYLSFSTPLQFPLSLKWSNLNTSCVSFFGGPISFALTNEIFYCVSGEWNSVTKDMRAYLEAFNINNGNSLFKTNIKQYSNETVLVGVVSIPPNYVAILDVVNAHLFILNGTNGNIIDDITIYDQCNTNTDYVCVLSGLTSSQKYKSVFINYAKNDIYAGQGQLVKFDIENNKIDKIYVAESIEVNPQIPTICNDDIVITTNLFANTSAFQIDPSTGQLSNLWNHTSIAESVYTFVSPPLCVPTSDGGFNVLIDTFYNDGYESWELLNGKTGELIKKTEWEIDTTTIPAINTDKMIMIRTTVDTKSDKNQIIAYNISVDDNGNNTKWKELYSINNETVYLGHEYLDIMIIDEYIFLCSRKCVDVYQITTGTKIYSWPLPKNEGESLPDSTSLAAGIDENGKPVIIVVAVGSYDWPYPINTTLYALQ